MGLSDSLKGKGNLKEEAKKKTWLMFKIASTDPAIEDLNEIGEPVVELPEPKPRKNKKLSGDIRSLYLRGPNHE